MTAIKTVGAERAKERRDGSLYYIGILSLYYLNSEEKAVIRWEKNGLWASLCILAASHVFVCCRVKGFSFHLSFFLSFSILRRTEWNYSLLASFVPFPFLLFADDYRDIKY